MINPFNVGNSLLRRWDIQTEILYFLFYVLRIMHAVNIDFPNAYNTFSNEINNWTILKI